MLLPSSGYIWANSRWFNLDPLLPWIWRSFDGNNTKHCAQKSV